MLISAAFAAGAVVSYGVFKVIQPKAGKDIKKKLKAARNDPFLSSDEEDTDDQVSEIP